MKNVLASLIAVGLIGGSSALASQHTPLLQEHIGDLDDKQSTSQVQAVPSDFLPAQHLEESDGLGGERSGQLRESAEDYVKTHQFNY